MRVLGYSPRVKNLIRQDTVPLTLSLIMALNGFVNLAMGLGSFLGWTPSLSQVPQYLRLAPEIRTSGMISVFLGVLLLMLGKGLYERRRRSWRLSLCVLCLLLGNSLYRNLFHGTTPTTAWVNLLLIVGLLLYRNRFQERSDTYLGYAQIIALVSIVFALGYAVVGSYLLRDEFNGITNWSDAIYFAVVTHSTVGYGDITPRTETAKIFTATVIPIGLAAFATAITALVGPAVERRMRGVLNLMQRIQNVKDHVVVCGMSHVAETVIEELQRQGIVHVIIEDREGLVAQLQGKGHDVIVGDASRRDVLLEANMAQASAVICAFDSDSVNMLIAVTAREIRDGLPKSRCRIIVRIEDEENIPKALRVGADEVVSPSTLGGQLMVNKALQVSPGV